MYLMKINLSSPLGVVNVFGIKGDERLSTINSDFSSVKRKHKENVSVIPTKKANKHQDLNAISTRQLLICV